MFSIKSASEILLPVRDYDLAATLESGQVFRWRQECGRPARQFQLPIRAGEPPALLDSWTGVIGNHSVRLTQTTDGIFAETAVPVENWDWLREFLQTGIDWGAILKTFPDDEPMRAAIAACRGLRVLRQEPWECLASFILSSTKQIVQIRQIIARLCERFGEPLTLTLSHREREQQSDAPEFSRDCPANAAIHFSDKRRMVLPLPRGEGRGEGKGSRQKPSDNLLHSFPSPEKIAAATEAELRACKMGFRAPHLLGAARQIADGKFNLETLRTLTYSDAKAELMKLRGIGGKIADCALLFAYGFDSAFPVDVWVERALRQLYFSHRHVTEKKLLHFAATHFGPHAGYAQQYLFHYMRTKWK